jgi:hypothetical protein
LVALAAFCSPRASTVCANAQTHRKHDISHVTPRIRRPSRVAFCRWLERARAGEHFEYHRGLLVRDRSPASELAERDRHALAEVADAVFRAAVDGSVHVIQHRHAPFDFSYLAIKAGRAATAGAGALPPIEQALAA